MGSGDVPSELVNLSASEFWPPTFVRGLGEGRIAPVCTKVDGRTTFTDETYVI